MDIKKILAPITLGVRIFVLIFITSLLFLPIADNLSIEFITMLTPIMFLIYSYIYIRKSNSAKDELELKKLFTLNTLGWGVVGVLIAVASNMMASAFIISDDFSSTTTQDILKLSKPLMVFVSGFLAPIAEELVFRLTFKDELVNQKGLHKVSFLMASGLIFGLLHIDGNALLIDNLGIITVTGVSGIGFGLVYLMSNNIWAPMLSHILYNLLIVSIII